MRGFDTLLLGAKRGPREGARYFSSASFFLAKGFAKAAGGLCAVVAYALV